MPVDNWNTVRIMLMTWCRAQQHSSCALFHGAATWRMWWYDSRIFWKSRRQLCSCLSGSVAERQSCKHRRPTAIPHQLWLDEVGRDENDVKRMRWYLMRRPMQSHAAVSSTKHPTACRIDKISARRYSSSVPLLCGPLAGNTAVINVCGSFIVIHTYGPLSLALCSIVAGPTDQQAASNITLRVYTYKQRWPVSI